MARTDSFIEIDGRRFTWKELLQQRRAQLAARTKAQQPPLFDDLKEDCRPAHDRTAAGRYSEPSLFSLPAREG